MPTKEKTKETALSLKELFQAKFLLIQRIKEDIAGIEAGMNPKKVRLQTHKLKAVIEDLENQLKVQRREFVKIVKDLYDLGIVSEVQGNEHNDTFRFLIDPSWLPTSITPLPSQTNTLFTNDLFVPTAGVDRK